MNLYRLQKRTTVIKPKCPLFPHPLLKLIGILNKLIMDQKNKFKNIIQKLLKVIPLKGYFTKFFYFNNFNMFFFIILLFLLERNSKKNL